MGDIEGVVRAVFDPPTILLPCQPLAATKLAGRLGSEPGMVRGPLASIFRLADPTVPVRFLVLGDPLGPQFVQTLCSSRLGRQ